jgi:HD-GYP domain-containing protein (c-di-GMP phosphodiesterase class II)/DNA-binding CsgD family transcriptional regulator
MTERPRLSELIASISLATDLGMGQPMEHALRTCLLSLGVARELGCPDQECQDVYYLALLRFAGCNAHAHEDALESGGDEIALRAAIAPVLSGTGREQMGNLFRHLGEGLPARARARIIARALAAGSNAARQTVMATCEVAQMMARRLGLGEALVSALGYTFEHYNGKGMPNGAKDEQIPLSARISTAARDIDVFHRIGGWDLVEEVLRQRRGRSYDPAVVNGFLSCGKKLLEEIESRPVWDAVIAADPSASPYLSDARLDKAFRCVGDFADLKCAFTRGHSTRVSELSLAAVKTLGLSETEATSARGAALVQEIGKAGVPDGILDKSTPLSPTDWERVRLHTYLTERVLARTPALADIAALASAHHERLDGSGYHKAAKGWQIPTGARVLAAADEYVAMTTVRPWRGAHSPAEAADLMRGEAAAGKLDAPATEAVLQAAGQTMVTRRRTWPAELSDREVEVLRLISLGNSNRQVAERLVISPKTVGRHIENIYAKIGVSTRAGAALFALQNDLVSPPAP